MTYLLNTLYCCIVRETLLPLILMIATPNIAVLFPYLIVHRKDPIAACLWNESWWKLILESWLNVQWFDPFCWTIILILTVWTVVTLVILPGRMYHGPPSVNNRRPVYWHNAFSFYLISMVLTTWYISEFSVMHLYFKLHSLFGILCLVGLVFCFLVYFKALFRPNSTDLHHATRNPIFNFYWGIELNPQLGRYINLKLLVICRIALGLWQWLALVLWKVHLEMFGNQYSLEQILLHPITVTTILVTVYLAKAFYWEDGYMQGLDVNMDRFGFMLAWGPIGLMPSLYTLPSLYLVENSPETGSILLNAGFLILGLLATFATYWVDYQRQLVRETNGQCKIWLRKPTLIRVKYNIKDSDVTHHSVLLASGFWGLARHLNYLFEWLASLSFALPTLITSPVPYLQAIFLLGLLLHRIFRDEHKCSAKYGKYWQHYCQLVPYRLIPYLF